METTKQSERTICVIGLGYIGLPTAAFMASAGTKVIGVDVNPAYVESINAGEVPFYEPDFDAMLKKVVEDGLLEARATTPEADAFIIAVPTPFADNYEVNDSYIMAAGKGVSEVLKGGELIVLESTSPPRMTERLGEALIKMRPDLTLEPGKENSIYLAHCPERVLPGQIMKEMVSNDRVIGGTTKEAAKMAADMYATFCEGELLLTDATTAEMAKLTENSFRDVNIAFANELSLICDELGISVWELIELANHHPRVNILQPGPGVGGHCIAVDPWFIVSSAPENSRLIRTAREVNNSKPDKVIEWVEAAAAKLGKESPTVAVLGLAFKADIDDLRESPSLDICSAIAAHFGTSDVYAVEPNVKRLPPSLEGCGIKLADLDKAIEAADIVVLLVDHKEFKNLDASRLDGKAVVDTKGLWRELPRA